MPPPSFLVGRNLSLPSLIALWAFQGTCPFYKLYLPLREVKHFTCPTWHPAYSQSLLAVLHERETEHTASPLVELKPFWDLVLNVPPSEGCWSASKSWLTSTLLRVSKMVKPWIWL